MSGRSGFGQLRSFHANDPGLFRFNPLQRGFAGSTVHFRDSCQRHVIRDYDSDATGRSTLRSTYNSETLRADQR